MSINFGPFSHNVLDYIDAPLTSKDGRDVIVKRVGMKFAIYVNGELYLETYDNISASYTLNQLECELSKNGGER